MNTYNANYWGDNFEPNRMSPFEDVEKHNKKMIDSAEFHASNMKENPSYLEKIMMEFLDNHNIKYEFQKIYYIKKKKSIHRYFIVDFYIPHRNIIIEVDGKFHKNQVDYDTERTNTIKQHFGKIKVIRFMYEDFSNGKLEELLSILRASSYRKITKESKKNSKKKKKEEAIRREAKIKKLKS